MRLLYAVELTMANNLVPTSAEFHSILSIIGMLPITHSHSITSTGATSSPGAAAPSYAAQTRTIIPTSLLNGLWMSSLMMAMRSFACESLRRTRRSQAILVLRKESTDKRRRNCSSKSSRRIVRMKRRSVWYWNLRLEECRKLFSAW